MKPQQQLIILSVVAVMMAAIIITPVASATSSPPFNSTTTTLLYDSPYSGIQIRYPQDWAYIDSGSFFTGGPFAAVIFMPPTDVLEFGMMLQQDPTTAATTDEMPLPSTSVTVLTMQLPFGNMDVRLFMDYLMTEERRYQIISTNPDAILSGMPAYEAVAVSLEPENRTKWFLVTAIQGERAYTVAYESQESTFDQFLPVARDMISSFTITP